MSVVSFVFEKVSLLKKQTFYREDAKSAKKINNARRKDKLFGERFKTLNLTFKNLGVLRVFAVRKEFLQCTQRFFPLKTIEPKKLGALGNAWLLGGVLVGL